MIATKERYTGLEEPFLRLLMQSGVREGFDQEVRLEGSRRVAHLVEKVGEYSMNANRMCKGPVAEGSLVRRRTASVAGLGEQVRGAG